MVSILGSLNATVLESDLPSVLPPNNLAGKLRLVLTPDYLQPELESINREQLVAGTPWLLVRPLGSTPWVGPIFVPGQTGCWACLAERLRLNAAAETPPMPAFAPKTAATVLTTALATATQWLDGDSQLAGKLFTLDLTSGQTHAHALLRRPYCPQCGTGIASVFRPLALDSAQPVSAEETVARYQHHISPILGLIRSIGRVSDNVYEAEHGPALPGTSFGKGSTDAQAQASAICEALERYSAKFSGHEPRRRARYDEMAGAVHPTQIMGFSDRQYQERNRWNGSFPGIFIPELFNNNAAIDWSPAWSLTQQAVRQVPTALTYLRYPPTTGIERWWATSSNGNAAGGTLAEATLQGLLEVIERDAVALWWYNRIPRPAATLSTPFLEAKRYEYQQQGRDLWLLDLTTDFEVPVFAAISRASITAFGFGCHLDAKTAAERAVAELDQAVSRETHILGLAGTLPQLRSHPQFMTLAKSVHFSPDPNQTPKVSGDYAPGPEVACHQQIDTIVEKARTLDLDILVVDMTRPEVGLPVVKVFIPGMCYWNVNLGYRRLYDVPVNLGWQQAPLAEHLLTPVPPLV